MDPKQRSLLVLLGKNWGWGMRRGEMTLHIIINTKCDRNQDWEGVNIRHIMNKKDKTSLDFDCEDTWKWLNSCSTFQAPVVSWLPYPPRLGRVCPG